MYIICMARTKRYSIAEARSHLPTIVDQAEVGQEIELTRRGKPVAVVVSLRELDRLRTDRRRFADAYKSFLRRYALDEVGLEQHFFDSIRDTSTGRAVAL